MECFALGDTGLTCRLPASDGLIAAMVAERLNAARPAGVLDVLPAFDSVTILYDPLRFGRSNPIAELAEWVRIVANSTTTPSETRDSRLIELPVRYGDDDGPDLNELAESLTMTPATLIDRHAEARYTVAAVGFLPGFAYLDGLPAGLHAPRRSTPRTRVPAGSVAIGGPYTGVYPVDSPGGWHLIGRTTAELFNPASPGATPFRVGDRVRFVPLSARRRRT